MDQVLKLWPVLLALWSLVMSWAIWSMRKEFASGTDVGKLDTRLSLVEAAVKSLPTKDDFHDLGIQLTRLEGDLKALAGLNGRIEKMLDMHQSMISDAVRSDK
jgi:hypothetical protein